MADFRLFVTAPSADSKVINRLLVYLRDWEDGSGDTFHLQTRDSAGDEITIAVPGTFTAATFHNAWAGASIEDVEAFAAHTNMSFFIVLDEQGVADHTVLCMDKPESEDDETDNQDDEDEEQQERRPAARDTKQDGDASLRFNKVRMPWHGAYLFCANIGEANMGFEEFCDEDIGPDERLYWNPNPDLLEDDAISENAFEKRAKLMLKLDKQDLI
jgi:hypothetical protein